MRQPFFAHLPPEVPCCANHFACHEITLALPSANITDCRIVVTRSAAAVAAKGLTSPRRQRGGPSTNKGRAMHVNDDFAELDDSTLLSRRAEMRAELERLPPASPDHAALVALYDKSTEEVTDRARKAWSRTNEEQC